MNQGEKIAEIDAREQRADCIRAVIEHYIAQPATVRGELGPDRELPLSWPKSLAIVHVDMEGGLENWRTMREGREAVISNLAGVLEHNGATPKAIKRVGYGEVTSPDRGLLFVIAVGFEKE